MMLNLQGFIDDDKIFKVFLHIDVVIFQIAGLEVQELKIPIS